MSVTESCADYELLLHALADGELDAGHVRDVETHAAGCGDCAEKLKTVRALREAMAGAKLIEAAPAHLRSRIEALFPAPDPVPAPAVAPTAAGTAREGTIARWWRSFIGGFAVGSALSGAVAAMLVMGLFSADLNQQVADEVVSAHIRSLQAGHLMDVQTSDQHTVKPWFNGKLDVAPPVIDLTSQGFTLLGGRLDYIDGEPVASVIYQRRKHVINLFVAQRLGAARASIMAKTIQGYNVRHWTAQGLDFWAVSDLAGDELDEFVQKISAALHPAGAS
ncbi:MAG TPA: anti-sigma factor [Xanthobacteraceae bacterium]|jgi:anti-sigma factor RsiW|nr:anti-sigma factor [Xanthobacteraceae bacterium]